MPKILLVEDDELNAEIVIRFLGAKNFEIVRAVDEPEAVSFCHSERPDLILMDMALPLPGDGQKATKEIRALPGMQTVPIIALTATSIPEKATEMSQAGCNDIVTKPIDLMHLQGRIVSLLNEKTHAS